MVRKISSSNSEGTRQSSTTSKTTATSKHEHQKTPLLRASVATIPNIACFPNSSSDPGPFSLTHPTKKRETLTFTSCHHQAAAAKKKKNDDERSGLHIRYLPTYVARTYVSPCQTAAPTPPPAQQSTHRGFLCRTTLRSLRGRQGREGGAYLL